MMKGIFRKIIIGLFVLVLIFLGAFSYVFFSAEAIDITHSRIETFTSDGTFTVPSGVTSVIFEGWGGGGGGASSAGGGGGGAYMKTTMSVSASQAYTMDVGAAGAAGGANGASSTVIRSAVTYLEAQPGDGQTHGGTGGLASGGIGDSGFNGGDGSQGTGVRTGGGGAGTEASGSGGTGGNYFGGPAPSSAAGSSRMIASGGGSINGAQRAGVNGLLRVTYNLNVDLGYPVIKTRNWGRTVGNTTSHPINLPTGIEEGDLLMVFFAIDGAPTLSGHTTNGWALLDDDTNGSSVTGSVFFKKASATSSNALTITSSASEDSSHFSLKIANGGIPLTTSANGASTNDDPPSLDTGTSAKYLFFAASVHDRDQVGTFTAAPTSYTDFLIQTSGTVVAADGVELAIATRHNQTQTENPGVFTVTPSDSWAAFTIAVPYRDPGDPITNPGTTVKTLINGGTTFHGGVTFQFFWPFDLILLPFKEFFDERFEY